MIISENHAGLSDHEAYLKSCAQEGNPVLKAFTVLMRWMKLEPIIQSEVSQKEKHQYSILTHIYGI